AAGREDLQREADQGPRRPCRYGRQFRRIGGDDDGLVSPRVVPPCGYLFRHLRKLAMAMESRSTRRCVGPGQETHTELPTVAAANLDGSRRPGQLQPERDAG